MKPVDEFLRSVRLAFRPEDEDIGYGWVWALLAIGSLVLLLVLRRARAGRRVRRVAADAFANVMANRKLGADDEKLLRRMAARTGVEPMLVATQAEAFETATAAELAAAPPPALNAPADDLGVFAQVGRLRHSLGFQVVPAHLPLVTTRQLASGQRVEVGAMQGEVTDVSEAWFTVDVRAGGAFGNTTAGQEVRLAFARGSEARYSARCAVAQAEPSRAPRRLTLRHDEKLERVQLRSAVRVPAHGAIELRARTGAVPPPDSGDAGTVRGELMDLSVGGIALSTETRLPKGASFHASFVWEGNEYRDLPVWVVACTPRSRTIHLVRLEFRGLPAGDEDRLAAAIAHRSAHVGEADKPSPG